MREIVPRRPQEGLEREALHLSVSRKAPTHRPKAELHGRRAHLGDIGGFRASHDGAAALRRRRESLGAMQVARCEAPQSEGTLMPLGASPRPAPAPATAARGSMPDDPGRRSPRPRRAATRRARRRAQRGLRPAPRSVRTQATSAAAATDRRLDQQAEGGRCSIDSNAKRLIELDRLRQTSGVIKPRRRPEYAAFGPTVRVAAFHRTIGERVSAIGYRGEPPPFHCSHARSGEPDCRFVRTRPHALVAIAQLEARSDHEPAPEPPLPAARCTTRDVGSDMPVRQRRQGFVSRRDRDSSVAPA
jgi:hypothetical protein